MIKWTESMDKLCIAMKHAGESSKAIQEQLEGKYRVELSSRSVRRRINELMPETKLTTSQTIIDMTQVDMKDDRQVLEAHGFDPDQFDLDKVIANIYQQGDRNQVQSKITVTPKREQLTQTDMIELTKHIKPREYARANTSDHNLVIPLADLHFGWTTYKDIAHSIKELQSIIKHGYKTIVFEQLGDLFHSDQVNTSQTVKGTQLDPSNMRQAFKDALQLFADLVPLAIQHSSRTRLYNVAGNHSGDLEYSFLYTLAALYPQLDIHFNDNARAVDWRCAYLLDDVGILLCHGDINVKRIAALFPTEYKGMWAKAASTEIHSGHFHTEKTVDTFGSVWRQLGTPKPNDPYEIRNGYTQSRKIMYAFEYDCTQLKVTYNL